MNLVQSIDFFAKDILDSSSKDVSNASSGLLIAVAALIHEHTGMERLHKGSMSPHKANTLHDRESGHYRLYQDYFTRPGRYSQGLCFASSIGC
jgi:hypothetical protein